MLDLTHDELSIIQSILKKFVPCLEVRVFGSRLAGNAKKFSDLDLAIMTDNPLPLSLRGAILDAFSESSLPFKVDVVDWAQTNADFQQVIANHFETLQTPMKPQKDPT